MENQEWLDEADKTDAKIRRYLEKEKEQAEIEAAKPKYVPKSRIIQLQLTISSNNIIKSRAVNLFSFLSFSNCASLNAFTLQDSHKNCNTVRYLL